MKVCDIVLIKSLNLEGMIISIGKDLETNEKKYQIHIQDQEETYFCKEEDLKFITTFDDVIDEFIEENIVTGKA